MAGALHMALPITSTPGKPGRGFISWALLGEVRSHFNPKACIPPVQTSWGRLLSNSQRRQESHIPLTLYCLQNKRRDTIIAHTRERKVCGQLLRGPQVSLNLSHLIFQFRITQPHS